jgi:pimeloyl-ACP methyl ester carboxylesterase
LLGNDYGRKTAVQWSKAVPKTLIVFVHGFRGSWDKTWGMAPRDLTADERFAESDLVFFDYECAGRTSQRVALQLRALCAAAVTDPAAFCSQSEIAQGRTKGWRYKRLLVVCHSLGAVIARRAILDGLKASEPWPEFARLILFAPAHKGARVHALLTLTIGALIGRLGEGLLRVKYPVLDELEHGSPTLACLAEESARQMDSARTTLEATAVIVADVERVVDTTPFLSDPPPSSISGTNHLTVCKIMAGSEHARDHVASGVWSGDR